MPTEIIAEFSSNHGGRRDILSRMLDEAVAARVDTIKVQSYETRHLSRDDPQFSWLQRSELLNTDHAWLLRECARKGMNFLTTVFHQDRVPFLASLGLPAIKIGSGEACNKQLLSAVAKHPWKVYVSTGLVTGHELDTCVDILHGHDVVLMHTVSKYPTLTPEVNLGRMSWLALRHGLCVGYSDHTAGIHAPLAAIARGAAAVEVHSVARGDVPRRNAWDKDADDLTTLVMFRDAMEKMLAPGRMLWEPHEQRPFTGRWNA
jgi:sialic acid synthase SpsE